MKKLVGTIVFIAVLVSVVLLTKTNTADLLSTNIAPNDTSTQPAITQEEPDELETTKEAIEIAQEKENSEDNQEEVKKPVSKPKEEKKTEKKESVVKPVEVPVSEPETQPAIEAPERIEEPKINKTEKRIEYVLSQNKNISKEDAAKLVALFEKFADEREYIDTELLMGMAKLESGFRVDCGEKYIGLMQVSAKYGEQAGYTLEQLKDPYYNLEYAMAILDDLNDKCDGNIKYILQSYNMGY